MSTLTEFLIAHQDSLGLAYTPLMTVYMLAIISPIWSAYLLLCSALSIAPKERFPFVQSICLYTRLTIDAILNPTSLLIYYYAVPYFFKDSSYFHYLYYTNRLNDLSIVPSSYFTIVLLSYFIWYTINMKLFKYVKPSIDFNKEYLISFFSPSRIFGAAAILIVMFDFEKHIAYLLWCNVYIGVSIALLRYAISLKFAFNTSKFLLTNK